MKANFAEVEAFRVRGTQMGTKTGDRYGAFQIPCGDLVDLIAIVSDGADPDGTLGEELGGWEHVSVRACDLHLSGDRIPTWQEMCFAKGLFWDAEEAVIQFHPPESEYVNRHPCVLHLWRPLRAALPLPPRILVG